MKRKNRSVRMRRGQSLMPFERGLERPLHVSLTTNEKLTQALGYTRNQRKYLETFPEDGRIPISNNLCEANIKPFATARRALVCLSDTPERHLRTGSYIYWLKRKGK